MNDSPPALLRGKELHCPRHLLRSSSFPHLRVARVRAALSPPWTISGPAGTQGAPRSCKRLGIHHGGGAALEDTGGRPRRRADWGLPCGGAAADGASCWGKMCWIASVCFCHRASRKRALSISLLSARLSHRWRSWTTNMDIAFPRDCAVTSVAHRARPVAERSSCFNLGLVLPSCILMPWLGVLAG